MKSKKIEFKILSHNEDKIIKELIKNKLIKSYLSVHKEIAADFNSLVEKKKSHFTYYIASLGGKSFSLLITENVSKQQPDYMTPWIEESKETLWMDLVFLDKEEINPELGAELLTAFVVFCPKEKHWKNVLISKLTKMGFFVNLRKFV